MDLAGPCKKVHTALDAGDSECYRTHMGTRSPWIHREDTAMLWVILKVNDSIIRFPFTQLCYSLARKEASGWRKLGFAAKATIAYEGGMRE